MSNKQRLLLLPWGCRYQFSHSCTSANTNLKRKNYIKLKSTVAKSTGKVRSMMRWKSDNRYLDKAEILNNLQQLHINYHELHLWHTICVWKISFSTLLENKWMKSSINGTYVSPVMNVRRLKLFYFVN